MPNNMLKEMLVKPLPLNLNLAPGEVNLVNNRMQHHKAILESFGITSLSGLGKLTISGNVIPQPGLTKPETNVMGAETMFQSAFRSTGVVQNDMRFVPVGGRAVQLKAIPFPQKIVASPLQPHFPGPISRMVKPSLGLRGKRPLTPANLDQNTVNIDTAYWVAEEIYIEENTLVVMKYPQKYLIIIAEKITVGKNVTFTWERPNIQKPAKPQKKEQKQNQEIQTSTTLSGVPGKDGNAGLKGEPGLDGADAPELEIWMLELNGSPSFDLRGQDGTQGGDGQDGQDGGNGWKGRAGIKDLAGAWCASGAGAGGNGGRGGAGGNGGDGGDGGHGGKLSLYAPQNVINNYLNHGFYVTVDSGKGGLGGIPGNPGAGGKGGPVGDTVKAIFETCGPKNGRAAGQPGVQGFPGNVGFAGKNGEHFTEALSMKVIDGDKFRRTLLEPVIFNTNPTYTFTGHSVTIDGKRFTNTDIVLIDGIPAQTVVYSDTRMQFSVPYVQGGRRTVQVKQSDNTLSNKGTIYVQPQLLPSSKPRVQPGLKVQLVGSGFAEGIMVKVNDQNMPDVKYISPTKLEFTLIRPVNIQENPTGEKVRVKVMLGDGTSSNEIELVLETFQMLVLGDSVQWGQGLMEHEKFHSLVATAIQTRNGGIGFYKDVLAHSGAIIGVDDEEKNSRLPGEVPSSYPTVLQQVDLFTGPADYVDLILLDGGFNDIGIMNVLNPHGPDLVQPAQKVFFDGMSKLLLEVTGKFKNAKIIVTGYYQPLSEHSKTEMILAMLTALGVTIGGIPVGTATTVLSTIEIQRIIERSKQIMELSRMHLKNAVDTVNATLNGGKRIYFADPNFGPSHAGLTNDPFIYGINPNLSPEDVHVAPSRAVECVNSNKTGIDLEICRIASVGHPNPKGAKAYAESILPLL